MSINYHNNYVAGFCLLPTYLVVALVLSKTSLLLWCIGMLIMSFVLGSMYKSVVLNFNDVVGVEKRYVATLLGQIIFWSIVIAALKYF